MTAIARRAEACGLDPVAVVAAGSEAVAALCRDTPGTALGRLMWRHLSFGDRIRRMIPGENGEPEPMITDAMASAAESYRALWVEWYRATGLPRRHPQGQQFERHEKAFEVNDVSADRMARLRAKLDLAESAVDALSMRGLAWATIDSVVIDNVLPGGMEFGDRSAAIHALRRGLEALTVLVVGRRNAS